MVVQTIVGVNPWVAHANTSVFGPDAEEFRPERWLEADQASVNHMEQYFFTVSRCPFCTFRYPPSSRSPDPLKKKVPLTLRQFGRGPRTCLGKSVTLMEMMKIIPELVLNFDFSFAYPLKEWSVRNDWFVKQEDFMVRIRERSTGRA